MIQDKLTDLIQKFNSHKIEYKFSQMEVSSPDLKKKKMNQESTKLKIVLRTL